MADLEQLNTLLCNMQQQYTETAGTVWRATDSHDDDGEGWWIEGTKPDGTLLWMTSSTRDEARRKALQMNLDGYGIVNTAPFVEFMRELLAGEFAITLAPTHGLKEIARG